MRRILKSRELARILESHGWRGKHNDSSHIIYRHAHVPAVLSFPLKTGGEVIPVGLLGKLQRLSGLKLRS